MNDVLNDPCIPAYRSLLPSLALIAFCTPAASPATATLGHSVSLPSKRVHVKDEARVEM